MIVNRNIIGVITAAICVIGAGCNNVENSPGWEYMPDMYRSSSYEPNGETPVFADSMANRPSVPGTITQGWVANAEYAVTKNPYPYKNDSLGYELAGQNLKNPFPATPEVIAQGKERYEKFCMHCHGATGAGDGSVVEKGNYPPPPGYSTAQLKNLPEGKMYHTIQYGKGMMGSHASQLTVEERWKIIRYVQTLQNPRGAAAPAPAAQDTAAAKKTADVNAAGVASAQASTPDTTAKK